jgi:hypothetical protein
MTYYHPPKRLPTTDIWIVVAIVLVIAAIGWTVVLAMIFMPTTHHDSLAEQRFLHEVKQSVPGPYEVQTGDVAWKPWPSDAELISEGHQVCAELDANGGNWDLVEASGVGPDFMSNYTPGQRNELVDDAAKNFCSRYSIWVGRDHI